MLFVTSCAFELNVLNVSSFSPGLYEYTVLFWHAMVFTFFYDQHTLASYYHGMTEVLKGLIIIRYAGT